MNIRRNIRPLSSDALHVSTFILLARAIGAPLATLPSLPAAVYKGSDGLVHMVDVTNGQKVYRSPVHKLVKFLD